MEVKAQLNNLRIAPRKVRLVSRAIKGMDVYRAKHQLAYLAKRSAKPLGKLLDSALANAHNNFGLVKENMFIKDMIVNEGMKLKRFRPKGFGMTSPIEKKTSHIKVILAEKVAGLKAEPKKKPDLPPAAVPDENSTAIMEAKTDKLERKYAKPERAAKGVVGGIKNIGRKFFRRKAI